MRILILGGTTFFGADIVRHLLAAGHHVAVFTRGHQRPDFWDRVEHIQGDRQDVAAFRARLAGERFDAVIDNIAYHADDVRQALAALAGRVGRYVLTSTGSVYRYARPHSPLDEAGVRFDWTPPGYDPADSGWQYAAGKVAAERALQEGDVPWTVIRPPIVLGPHDVTHRGHFYFRRLMDGGPLLLRDGGVASFRLAYSDDLAGAYRLALETDQALGRAYNICQPEVITLYELCAKAAAVLGVTFNPVSVPAEALTKAGLSGGPYSHMTNFIPSIERAQRELGYTATDFDTWLATTVRWYRDEYRGPEPEGYGDRPRELAFGQRWRSLVAGLSSA